MNVRCNRAGTQTHRRRPAILWSSSALYSCDQIRTSSCVKGGSVSSSLIVVYPENAPILNVPVVDICMLQVIQRPRTSEHELMRPYESMPGLEGHRGLYESDARSRQQAIDTWRGYGRSERRGGCGQAATDSEVNAVGADTCRRSDHDGKCRGPGCRRGESGRFVRTRAFKSSVEVQEIITVSMIRMCTTRKLTSMHLLSTGGIILPRARLAPAVALPALHCPSWYVQ